MRLCNLRGLILIVAGILMSACSSVSGDSESSQQVMIAQGEAVYQQNCASCHGENGEGQNPDAPLAKDATGRYPAPPHNDTGHTWHHDDDLLVQIVTEGGMGPPTSFYPMPAFGSILSQDEIKAVIEYIKTMWSEEQREYQRQVTEAGRAG